MTTRPQQPGKKSAKYHRARLRHFLFTSGPHRLTGGRLTRRHIARPVAIREIEIVNPRWPAALDGLRIAHVSDFHLGDLLPLERGIEIVSLLADQSPDLVACTGDVVDLHAAGAEPLLKALAETGAPMGSLLVLGNHDELDDERVVVRMAEKAGMTVLRNRSIEVSHGGARLSVGGIDWARSQKACAAHVERLGAGRDLLLAHNPRAFQQASKMGIPLTLSGHTHGGQIAIKNRPNANLAFTQKRRAGLFEENGSHLYVTTGVGAWFPLRVNCPPEIAMITMRCAAA